MAILNIDLSDIGLSLDERIPQKFQSKLNIDLGELTPLSDLSNQPIPGEVHPEFGKGLWELGKKFSEAGYRVSRGIGTWLNERLSKPFYETLPSGEIKIRKEQAEDIKAFTAGFTPELYPDYPKNKISTIGEEIRKSGEELFNLYGTPEEAKRFYEQPEWRKNIAIGIATAGRTAFDFISIIPDVYTNPASYLTLKTLGEGLKLTPLEKINITKKLTIEYRMPENIEIPAQTVRDSLNQGLNDIEKADLLKIIGVDNWKTALKNGSVNIEVPARKIITITDRPWWGKVKQVFGKPISEPKISIEYAGRPVSAPTGLLPEAPTIPKIKPEMPPPVAPIRPKIPIIAPPVAKPEVTTFNIVSKNPILQKAYTDALTKIPNEIKKDIDIKGIRQIDFPEENQGEGGRLEIDGKGNHFIFIEKGEENLTDTILHEAVHSYVLKHPEIVKQDYYFGMEDAVNKITSQILTKPEMPFVAPTMPQAGGIAQQVPETIKKWLEKGIEITERQAPVRIVENIQTTDILGNKVTLPKGEEYTPYKLSNNKIWLHDGKNIVIDKNKLTDIQNKNIVLGEGQPMAGGIPPTEPPQITQPQPGQPQDPGQKVISAIKEAKSVRRQQETLYTRERARRFAKARAVGERVTGEKGFYAEKAQLRGELPKVEFESLRGKISQEDIDKIFTTITDSPKLTYLQKLSAREGLVKLFGEAGGSVPTEREIALLSKVFPREFIQTLLEKRPLNEKIKEGLLQAINLPRTIMSSFLDLSFGFRQGLFAAPYYRKQFYDSFKKQFGWFGSEKAFQENNLNIQKNPHFELATEAGISFTELSDIMSLREERYAGSWGERIPIIGKRIIRPTSRAYTAFANKLRMDVFSQIVENAKKVKLNPYDDRDLAKAMANFVNAATGRGSLGGLEKAAVALNGFFFSPRLMASRLTLLNPFYYTTQEPFVRKEALKALFAFAGTILTVLGVAKLAGLKVGTDPRSADVAKIRIGNTRIDIMGGFQPYIRMAIQLITGKYVSSVTGKVITLGEGYKPITRLEILGRQIESKEAPIFSLLTDLLKGQDFEGKKVNVPKEIGQRFIPMVMGDIYDIAKDDPKLLPIGLLGVFGVGIQTYKPRPMKKGKLDINLGDIKLDENIKLGGIEF